MLAQFGLLKKLEGNHGLQVRFSLSIEVDEQVAKFHLPAFDALRNVQGPVESVAERSFSLPRLGPALGVLVFRAASADLDVKVVAVNDPLGLSITWSQQMWSRLPGLDASSALTSSQRPNVKRNCWLIFDNICEIVEDTLTVCNFCAERDVSFLFFKAYNALTRPQRQSGSVRQTRCSIVANMYKFVEMLTPSWSLL